MNVKPGVSSRRRASSLSRSRETGAAAPVRFRSAAEAERYLLGHIDYELRVDYRQTTRTHDLRRFARLLEDLGWDPAAVPAVHVGGTNGKGSVCWLLEAILRAGGQSTGLYASPHLADIRERIRLDGKPLSRSRFRDGVSRLAGAFADRPRAGFRTLFEHLTALALLEFKEARADRAVVEVGLGGRLDATNVLPAGPVVLTPISRDHENVLGRGIARIAADKARIIKPGGRAYLMPQPPRAAAAIRKRLEKTGAGARWVQDAVEVIGASVTRAGSGWEIRGRRDYGRVDTRLLGAHQASNLAAAVAVAEDLLPPGRVRGAVRVGLQGVRVPGRLEHRRVGGRSLILDGGHNPAAGEAVAAALRRHLPGRKVVGVVGIAADKDWEGYLAALEPAVERFVFTAAGYPRAADPRDLAALVRVPAEVVPRVRDAVDRALAAPEEIVLVAGSFVVLGEALEHLGRRGGWGGAGAG